MLFRSLGLAAVAALAVEATSDVSCGGKGSNPSAPIASGSPLPGSPPSGSPPSGSSHSESLPSGSPPSGSPPSGSPPSGFPPSGAFPSGSPSGSPPSGSPPSGSPPSGFPPSGAFPSGSPYGSPPSGSPPSGVFPPGSVPSVSIPSGSSPSGLPHSASVPGSAPRYVMYYDQYHTTGIPDKSITDGITHVITAFANSSLFASEPAGEYKPFKPLNEIRALFNNDTKFCMAIGGWGDTDGFGHGAATNASRIKYAKNVANTAAKLGYDCVDVDWEYPGGNGADYKQIPNANKTQEINTFPLLLSAIRSQLKPHNMELSVTAPGLKRDMIAFTKTQVPKMNAAVDFVTIMAYDFANRRDLRTKYHTDVQSSLEAIDTYIALGFEPAKMNLGLALYAKWFTTAAGYNCTQGIGCPTELLEAADGSDTGKSGAVTFEASNFQATPTNLTTSTDSSCGAGTFYKCPTGNCCSQYGYCGATAAHCGNGCQSDYGICNGTSTLKSFKTALANGHTDEVRGGQWYWDPVGPFFWTWDTPALVARKFNEIVKARGIGGVAVWSLGEDSYDFALLKAIQAGVKALPKK